MSENVAKKVQHQIELKDRPRRNDWTRFSQGLAQILRGSYHRVNNASLSESLVMKLLGKLRQQVVIQGAEKTVRLVMRTFEFASADAFIIVCDETVEEVPDKDVSDYDLWRWARSRPRGVRFVPLDVKTTSLSIGVKTGDRNKRFFNWTRGKAYKRRVNEAEAYIGMVEDIPDYFAVVPSAAWVEASDGSYGIETLTGKAPLWMPLFMVHLDDLREAVLSIADAATKGTTYVNPTNMIALSGWEPSVMERPNFDPSPGNLPRQRSFEGALRLFDEIERSGLDCRVEFNPAAPVVIDFYLVIGEEFVRVEFKEFDTFESMDHFHEEEPRSDPWADRRMWHVLYLKIGGKTYCITRDEAGGEGRPDDEFIERHVCPSGFADAFKHIKLHADAARQEAIQALRGITPTDVATGRIQREIRPEIVLSASDGDPLAGHSNAKLTLPWLSHQLNVQCMENGYGVCLALGSGHPLGTHVMVEYRWTKRDKELFRRYGKLPLQLWYRAAIRARCVVLRFQQHSPMESLMPSTMPFACLRGQWKKTVEGMGNFLIVGSIVDSEAHSPEDPTCAEYLLIPSKFTALGNGKSFLQKLTFAERKKGQHFFGTTSNTETEMSDPKWPTKKNCILLNKNFMTDPEVNVFRYVLSLTDGTLYNQICGVLAGDPDSMMRIGHRDFANGNKAFRKGDYHLTVRDVLRVTWIYGYERSLRTQGKKGELARVDEDVEDQEMEI